MQLHASALSQWSASLSEFVVSLIWTSMPSALLYGAAGLVVAIILMVWVARKNWLCRRPRAWNVLAKLSYVAILLVTLFAFTAAGVVRHVQRETLNALETAVTPLLRVQTVVLRQYVSAQIAAYAPGHPVTARELVDATLQDFYYKSSSDSMWERGKARIVNWTLRKLGREVLTAAFEKIIIARAEIRDRTQGDAAKVGVDALRRVLLDAKRDVDLAVLDRTLPQIILDAAGNQIRATFQRGYLMIALIWLAVGAGVAGEMLLYFRWYEKRRKARQPLRNNV